MCKKLRILPRIFSKGKSSPSKVTHRPATTLFAHHISIYSPAQHVNQLSYLSRLKVQCYRGKSKHIQQILTGVFQSILVQVFFSLYLFKVFVHVLNKIVLYAAVSFLLQYKLSPSIFQFINVSATDADDALYLTEKLVKADILSVNTFRSLESSV